MAFEEGRDIEGFLGLTRQSDLLRRDFGVGGIGNFRYFRIIRAGDFYRLRVLFEPPHDIGAQIIGADKGPAASDRPGQGHRVQRQGFLDFIEQVEGIARLTVHLVDEGDDGNVAQAADFEQFAGARLDALGGVDDHDRAVDRRERAIGVLGKVLVARRVEQVVDAIAIFEGHHRGDHRNAALALDAHPVGAGLAAIGLGAHFAGQLDRAAEQQQLFGQRGLAGVGMRNDGEGAPPRHRIGILHFLPGKRKRVRLISPSGAPHANLNGESEFQRPNVPTASRKFTSSIWPPHKKRTIRG